MASLFFPPQVRSALRKLAQLNQSAFDEISGALDQSKANVFDSDFTERLASTVKSVEPDAAQMIFGSLIGLHLGRSRAERTVQQVAQDAAEVFVSASKEDGLSAEEQKVLVQRLTALLSHRNLEISVKAFDVQTSHQRAFAGARVFTDMRPVFGEEVDDGPTAAVLTHTLRIEYRESGELREFFVAFDEKDLKELGRVLSRASAKEIALRALLEKAGLPYLSSE